MRKFIYIIICLCFILCLVGCNVNVDGDLSEKNLPTIENTDEELLKIVCDDMENIYASTLSIGSASIQYDNQFDIMVENIKTRNTNFYLINYAKKDKYVLGYLPSEIVNEISGFLYFPDYVNKMARFKRLLSVNEVEFNFEDIIWEIKDNIEKQKEGYELYFSYKINEVEFVSDIHNSSINKTLKHYSEITIQEAEGKKEVIETFPIENGSYFMYFNNLNFNDNIVFNNIYTDLYNIIGAKSCYVKNIKLAEGKLLLIDEDESLEMFYKNYKDQFENIIVDYEDTIIGDKKLLFDFNEFKELAIDLTK